MGCRLLALPAGALYDMDWTNAHLDNAWFDDSRVIERYRRESAAQIRNSCFPGETEIHGNAISPPAPEVK